MRVSGAVQTAEQREQWLAERRRGVGASEVGILFGVSPYGSLLSLWAEKTGRETAERTAQAQMAMRVGHELEGLVCKLAAEELGYPITRHSESLEMPGHPLVRATPDGFVEAETRGAFDAKVVGQHNMGEWLDGLVPLDYQIQLQTQMLVTGCKWAVIAGLLLGAKRQLVCQRIEFDPELGQLIVDRVEWFWRTWVQTDMAPPADDHSATTAALKVLHPYDNGMCIPLNRPLEHAKAELVAAKAEAKDLKKRIALRENQLRLALADATYGVFPDGTGVSLKTQKTSHGGTARHLRMLKPKGVELARKDSDERLRKLEESYR